MGAARCRCGAAGRGGIGGCGACGGWRREGGSGGWLLPGRGSRCRFAGLRTVASPSAAGRADAAYGGIYIAVALAWLALVEGVRLTTWDMVGAGVAPVGMAIIGLQPTH